MCNSGVLRVWNWIIPTYILWGTSTLLNNFDKAWVYVEGSFISFMELSFKFIVRGVYDQVIKRY